MNSSLKFCKYAIKITKHKPIIITIQYLRLCYENSEKNSRKGSVPSLIQKKKVNIMPENLYYASFDQGKRDMQLSKWPRNCHILKYGYQRINASLILTKLYKTYFYCNFCEYMLLIL